MSEENEWFGFTMSSRPQVGFYGWRKKCLYLMILGLLFVVTLNLALTMWIIQVLGFNSVGMGDLRLVQQGIQLPNCVYILGSLITSAIFSYKPMTIDSCHNINIITKNGHGQITNNIYLEKNLLQMDVNMFKVTDKLNSTVFIVNKEEVAISADNLSMNGVGGNKLDGYLQTSVIEAENSNLRLESPADELEISAADGVIIETRAGEINLTSAFNIELNSGSLKIESPLVLLPALRDITGNSSVFTGIFQLCACDNGKLFLGRSDQRCAKPEQSILC